MKRIAYILIALLLLVLCIPSAALAVDWEEPLIESVYMNMPDMNVFFYMTGTGGGVLSSVTLSKENITNATLGDTALEVVSASDLADSETGSAYFICMDLHREGSKDSFTPLLDQICKFYDSCVYSSNGKNELVLIPFNCTNTKPLIIAGNCTKDDAAQQIRSLSFGANTVKGSNLVSALKAALDLSDANAHAAYKHKLVMAITLAETDTDCTAADITALRGAFQTANLPVYGVGITYNDGSNADNLAALGSLCRSSSGVFEQISTTQTATALDTFRQRIGACYTVAFRAPTNRANGTEQQLRFTVDNLGGKQTTAESKVTPTLWQQDTVAPEAYLQFEESGAALTLSFSEPMLGTGLSSSYTLLKDGKAVDNTFTLTTFTEGVLLEFSPRLFSGDYTLRISGVTDDSMEENPLGQNEFEFSIPLLTSSAPDEDISETNGGFWDFIGRNWWLIALIAAVAVFLLIFLLVTASKKKKEKEKEAVIINPTYYPASTESALELVLQIVTHTGTNTQTVRVTQSYIVGRSKIYANLSIEDPQLSRKHFELLRRCENLFIRDLNSTNGVFIGAAKKRLVGEQLVSLNETIWAGGCVFTVLSIRRTAGLDETRRLEDTDATNRLNPSDNTVGRL